MPSITAIVHTRNDEGRLGRTLESLRPCDEIVVVDCGSTDDSLRIAREYGAVIRGGTPQQLPGSQFAGVRNDWILCVLPSEILTEALEASLYEWKLLTPSEIEKVPGGAVVVREEKGLGWTEGSPSTRLVPKTWSRWDGQLPCYVRDSVLLDGDLLRFQSRS